jgi:phage tail sheath protein FI
VSPPATTQVSRAVSGPIFSQSDIGKTQRGLIELARDERWRMLVLLSVPLFRDPTTGAWGSPAAAQADDWRKGFDSDVKLGKLADTLSISCAALYWPWVLNQEQVDGPVVLMPPSPYAAGVIARRDLARGPQFSPANETLKQVVATAVPVDDDANALLYAPPADRQGAPTIAVDVLRAFSGYGIQVWGARTMSTDPWLQYIVVRRTLTAVELRMKAALEMLVFEPNTPTLWLHITHVALGVLLPLYESGALRGSRPEEAFYIRCDATVNTADTIAEGWLLVEVGVAVATPAEFIVFRVGRREGVVEVVE